MRRMGGRHQLSNCFEDFGNCTVVRSELPFKPDLQLVEPLADFVARSKRFAHSDKCADYEYRDVDGAR